MFRGGHDTLRAVRLESGDRLGRYQILCPLASGGMASVYAARVLGEGAFQKPVALKLMLPHLARDEKFVAMFMDEAALAAQIQSPHVVATHDLGREGADTLYMALELVLGCTLRELGDAAESAPGGIPLDVALTLIVQAARGLDDAHRARSATGEALDLVHRDISPHNVLVGLDGRARISDFGIARAVARTSQTETGELKGKLAYFSPEQLRGVPLDQRSDVFALGVVAWELLAGKRLFEADNPLALADRIANAPIRHLDTVRRDLPPGVAGAVASALVRDPEKRLASAGLLADRLVAAMAAAGTTPASPARVGQVVRALGGERVQLLEKRIMTLFRELPLPASADTSGAHRAQLVLPAPPAGPTSADPTGTGSGVVVVRRGPSPLVLAGLGVLIALGAAGGAYLLLRAPTSDARATPAPAPNMPPATAAEPPPRLPATAALPTPSAAPNPENTGTSSPSTGSGESDSDNHAESPPNPDSNPSLNPPEAPSPGGRAVRTRTGTRAVEPRAATAAVASPPSSSPAPAAPTAPAPPARRGGLVGVDEFDGDESH
jgi:serine/threonine protein kinase